MSLLGDAKVKIRPDFTGFEQETKRGISSAGPALAAAAKGVLAGAALAIGTAGVIGVKTAAQMEQAKISFETMLGSAQKADKFLKQLSDFAATTPFEFPELQTAASSLISAGIQADKVIPIMTTLGDVTAGMGTGSEGIQRATVALQQMTAAGKITGEDLNQLRDAGIPVYDLLAAATGRSKAAVIELAQAGKLGGKELGQLMKALETGKGLERFNGLMEKQSKSLGGIFSTLKDTVNMQLAGMITPLIPTIKKVTSAVTPVIGNVLSGIGKGLNSAVTYIEGTAIPALRGAFKGATGKNSPFQPIIQGATDLVRKVGPGFIKLGSTLLRFWNQISPTLADVGRSIMSVLGPALSEIGDLFRDTLLPAINDFLPAFAPVARFLIEVIGGTVVQVLKGAIDIVKGVIRIVAGLLKTFTGVFTGDWEKAWEGIKDIFGGAWQAIQGAARVALFVLLPNVLRKGGTAAWGLLQRVTTGAFQKLVSFVSTRPGAIAGALSRLGSFLRTSATRGFDIFRNTIKTKIGEVVTFLGGVPAKIGNAFKSLGSFIVTNMSRGVNVMLRWVNDNIIGKLNTITSKFGLNLPRIAISGRFAGGGNFASGGIIPGYTPGRDTKTINVGGGEAIMRPEWTKAIGSDAVHAMNAAARRGGVRGVQKALQGRQGFAAGGVVDWVTSGVKKAAASITGPAIDAFSGRFRGSFAGDLLIGVLRKLATKISEWGAKQDTETMGGASGGGTFGYTGGGRGVQRWAPVVLRALAMVGQPASMLGITLRRMNQESGGNPRAINNWDINAKRGTPSMGLMQTIGPTFNAYAGALRSRGVWDPLANIYASMRYALARYGNLPSAYNRKGGYATGVNLAGRGWKMVGENGPELVNFKGGETVKTNRQSMAMQGDITVQVFVGDREITDIVDTRISRQYDQTATKLRYGRR